MSESIVEDEVELKDLLAETLEKNGCLAKIRAQLRASIFLALDEDKKISSQQPLQNLQIKGYLETSEGKLMFNLVRDFLEFFNLHETLSVYEAEASLNINPFNQENDQISKQLGLNNNNTSEPTVPLLQQILKIAQTKSRTIDIKLNLHENTTVNGNNTYKKTESSVTNTSLNNESENQLNNNNNNNNKTIEIINRTFEVHNPFINNIGNLTVDKIDEINNTNDLNNGYTNEMSPIMPKLLKELKEDDTYEDTSSIAEDSEALIDVPSEIPSPRKLNNDEKSNLFNMSSLADLPPLTSVTNNKTKKPTKILTELDKMLEDYEDDFDEKSSSKVNSDKSSVKNKNNICSKSNNSSTISECIPTESIKLAK